MISRAGTCLCLLLPVGLTRPLHAPASPTQANRYGDTYDAGWFSFGSGIVDRWAALEDAAEKRREEQANAALRDEIVAADTGDEPKIMTTRTQRCAISHSPCSMVSSGLASSVTLL